MKTSLRMSGAGRVAVLSAVALVALPLGAAPRTWDGGAKKNSLWGTADNWNNDTVPQNGDSLVFAGTVRTTNDNNTSLTNVGLITFSNGNFTISGSPLRLDAGILNSAGTNAWGINSTLGANQSFTSAAGATLNITGALNLGSYQLTLDGAGTTALSNVVGDGSLVKSGTGSLTLSNANTYTGGTTISSGILKAGHGNALGGGDVSIASGAVLDLNNQNSTPVAVNALTGSGTIRNEANGGAPTTETHSTIAIGGKGASSTFAGSIQNGSFLSGTSGYQTGMGVVNVQKDGAGTLTLTGQNSYTGTTKINQGAIEISGTGTLGNVGAVSIASGASLIVNRAGAAATAGAADQNDYTLASKVDGAGTLVKKGTGTLTLSNQNSAFTGGIDVQQGTLNSAHSNALGSGTVSLANGTTARLGGGVTQSGFSNWATNSNITAKPTISADGDQLVVTTQASNQATSSYATAKVDVTQGYTASYVYLSRGGNSATSGRADGVAFILQNDIRGTTALGGHGSGNGYAALNGGTAITNSDLLVLDTHTLSQTGHVTGGAENSDDTGSSRHWGNGTSASDSHAFDDTLSPVAGLGGAGSVDLRNAMQPIQVNLVYDPVGKTLKEALTNLTTGAIYTRTYSNVDVAAATNAGAGGTAYMGFTGGTGSLTAWQTVSNFSFTSGVTSGSYANTFAVKDSASATLDAAVSDLTVAGISLGSSATLDTTASTVGANTAYTIKATSGTLKGAGTVNVNNNGAGAGTLVLNNVGQSAAGSSLTKTGTGTLAMGGTGAYSGGTTVNGGTLRVSSSGALGSGAVRVNSGGTLDLDGRNVGNVLDNHSGFAAITNTTTFTGTHNLYVTQTNAIGSSVMVNADTHLKSGVTLTNFGQIGKVTVENGGRLDGDAAGAVEVQSGGTIAVNGSNVGTMTATGDQTWKAGGAYEVDMTNATGTPGVGWDQLVIQGGVTGPESGKFTIKLTGHDVTNFPTGPSDGVYTWLVASITTGSFDVNHYRVMVSGFDSTVKSWKWGMTTVDGGKGLAIQYSFAQVPEATTLLLGATGVVPLLLSRRRRNRAYA